MVCTHAAGCDLFITYTSIRGTRLHDGHDMMDALLHIFHRAQKEFRRCPEVDRLLALMDVQIARACSAQGRVRMLAHLLPQGFAKGWGCATAAHPGPRGDPGACFTDTGRSV